VGTVRAGAAGGSPARGQAEERRKWYRQREARATEVVRPDRRILPRVCALTEQAARLALDVLERLFTRAEELQRELSAGAWGPAPEPLDLAGATAAALAAIDALETLGPDAVEGRAQLLRERGIGPDAGASPAGVWVGWWREHPPRPWQPVVRVRSEAEALDLLLQHYPGGDKCVLPSGQDPNRREARGRSDG
jgi:hypothetical protein